MILPTSSEELTLRRELLNFLEKLSVCYGNNELVGKLVLNKMVLAMENYITAARPFTAEIFVSELLATGVIGLQPHQIEELTKKAQTFLEGVISNES